MGVAALVLGIITILFAFIPGLNFISPFIGVLGITLGVLARNRLKKEGKPADIATGGMVTSIVGTIFGFITYMACAALFGGGGYMFNNMFREMEKQGISVQKVQDEMRKKMEKAMQEGAKEQKQ